MPLKHCFCAIFACAIFAAAIPLTAEETVSERSARLVALARAEAEKKQYVAAYEHVNKSLGLYDAFEAPEENIALAKEIYARLLEEMEKTRDFSRFDEIVFSLRLHPDVATADILYRVQSIYATTTIETLRQSIENLGDKLERKPAPRQKADSAVVAAIFVLFALVLLLLALMMLVLRALSKRTALDSAALEALARSCAPRLENPALRIEGSSLWGGNALPPLSAALSEQDELRALAVSCAALGEKIDKATGRVNSSKSVAEIVHKLAAASGLSQSASMLCFCAAQVHDAGFLGVPEELLRRESLSGEERRLFEAHVLEEKFGPELAFVPQKYRRTFEDAAKFHHENMDGSGYPDGLSGEEIPLVARLIRVAERYSSLVSQRSGKESAVRELGSQPKLYDSGVVSALSKII